MLHRNSFLVPLLLLGKCRAQFPTPAPAPEVDPNPESGNEAGLGDFVCQPAAPNVTDDFVCVYPSVTLGGPSFPFEFPNSFLAAFCPQDVSTGIEPSIANCNCVVFLGTLDDLDNSLQCETCTFLPSANATDGLWSIEYDCSTVLAGPCVGRDANGNCIAGAGPPAESSPPSDVPSSVPGSSAPSDIPTFVPASDIPTGVPASDQPTGVPGTSEAPTSERTSAPTSIAGLPENNMCEGALVVDSVPFIGFGDHADATPEGTGSSALSCPSVLPGVGKTLWYTLSPQNNGCLSATASGDATDIVVYEGTDCSNLLCVAEGMKDNLISWDVSWSAMSGATYKVLILFGDESDEVETDFTLIITPSDGCF